jgi:hypothetical protein
MKKHLLLFVAWIFAVVGLHAQSLKFLNVSDPGIYCRFSPDCHVVPVGKSSSFMPTNLAVTCALESRSFVGNSTDTTGVYGYEYRVILNNAGAQGDNLLTVDSLTLNFDSPQYFAFGGHASNQVWVVATGGAGSLAPGSASFMDTNVVFQFDPPIVLATKTNQSTGTYYFGMMSTGRPHITMAVITGSAQASPDAPVPFEEELPASTP